MNKNTYMTLRIDKELKDKFNQKYPNCASKYLRECMKMAIENPKLFVKIFFRNLEE